jgi:hypothetical protein
MVFLVFLTKQTGFLFVNKTTFVSQMNETHIADLRKLLLFGILFDNGIPFA